MMNLPHKLKSFFGRHPEEDQVLETIEEIMDQREERGDKVLVDPDELLLLKNLFKLKDIRAGQIMIPRIDIVGISADASLEELKNVIINEKFTRLPVYDKTLDNIVGVVHVKDVLCALFEKQLETVKEVMTSNVLFVPQSIRALDLLRDLQEKRTQMAVVIDEYGGTDGLITLEDLLEEIVGEIEDEHDALDTPPTFRRIDTDTIEADARIFLKDLEAVIGSFVTPAERSSQVGTVGGLVFHLSGRLPHRGEIIKHSSGIVFQVIDLDTRHIKKVRITRLKALQGSKKQTKMARKIK